MADPEYNIEEIAQGIASEVFGGGEETPPSDGTPSGVVTPPAADAAPDSTPSPGITPPPNQYTPKALPKSWKKEMDAHWGKLPKEIHDYVYEREADVMRGIQMYKERADRWGNLIQPYEEKLASAPDVDPIKLMQTLMNNHLAIAQGTPEQKKVLAQHLLKSYGIDLGSAAGGAPVTNTENTEIALLRQELNQLKTGWSQAQQKQYDAEIAEHKKTVIAFGSDPKNKYFEEVGMDVLRLLQNKVADSLESAYEQACWLNPGVRAKMLAEQSTQFKPQNKNTPTNINGSGEGTPSKSRKAPTMDETILGVVQKHHPEYKPH